MNELEIGKQVIIKATRKVGMIVGRVFSAEKGYRYKVHIAIGSSEWHAADEIMLYKKEPKS